MKDMKILAIIPACEGSESLPNKNLRIINGKPLIYYSINNAKKSKYINDIIVTTNSKEILSIAAHMKVIAEKRDERLCNINVSLDEVIFSLKQEVNFDSYDYIVTMQSISPTLKHSTLDHAIERCIDEQCDTMISVSNRANFYWGTDNDIPLPIWKVRMNKHQLPPFYMETGAFLITKPGYITKESRIGDKCLLYELDPTEAIDVFSFGDLKQAENIICQKSVAFYVNGNNQRGMGHIYRVFQLADEFFSKPDIYYDKNQTSREMFGKTSHNLIPVNGENELLLLIKNNQYDIFINDILSTSIEYMTNLRKQLPDGKIINFEDDGEGAVLADIVFNALYEEKFAPNVKVGADYFVASKLFLLYEPISIKKNISNILVTFGGADPQNYTERFLNIIKQTKYDKFHFYIVIGRAKENCDVILSNDKDNIEILYNIENMAEIMSKCDIAVTSRGRTGYELAMLGIPTISMAQNDREEKHNFISAENGFIYLGQNPSDRVIEDALDNLVSMSQHERHLMQMKMLRKDLHNGRKHIMNLIDNL